jgi:regulator of replication initiation timing
MDKRTLYDGLTELESTLQKTLAEIIVMKEEMQEIIQQNTILEMETQRLRDRLQKVDEESAKVPQNSAKTKQEISNARKNLENLYEEGFHVCNEFYGKRRENDEGCLLCMEVIDR